jgi:hypothetical protein
MFATTWLASLKSLSFQVTAIYANGDYVILHGVSIHLLADAPPGHQMSIS